MAMRVDMPRGAALVSRVHEHIAKRRARCICGMPIVEESEDGRRMRCAAGCKWLMVGDGADRRRNPKGEPMGMDPNKHVENTAKLPEVITAEGVERFETAQFKKKGTTRISTFTVPPGTTFDTPEGLKAEDEPCRIAWDTQGGVYPIRESVFQESYEPA